MYFSRSAAAERGLGRAPAAGRDGGALWQQFAAHGEGRRAYQRGVHPESRKLKIVDYTLDPVGEIL